MKGHGLTVRWRAFNIWRKLGFLPWAVPKSKSKKGDFYKGAFDSIPFLNDDAKRTFVHLLLRPGYMIRDYIKGQHERYLAPLTSLIIFYAFFALVSSIVNPEYSTDEATKENTEKSVEVRVAEHDKTEEPAISDIVAETDDPDETDEPEGEEQENPRYSKVLSYSSLLSQIVNLLSLDKHPELIDSPLKASIAALENSLRSQGVYNFLGQFLLLWFAMFFCLKKKGHGLSACAATAAYVLCQFCFFMLFTLFFPWGNKGEIGAGLSGVLLTVDYHQLFDLRWKKSFWLAVKTGVYYVLTYIIFILLFAAVVLALFFIRANT